MASARDTLSSLVIKWAAQATLEELVALPDYVYTLPPAAETVAATPQLTAPASSYKPASARKQPSRRRWRRKMTDEQKQAVADRMKKYWAERRKAGKAKKSKK